MILPSGKVVQRVQGSRLTRVVWKMVRGLYAVEHDQLLPEDKARFIGFNHPHEPEIPDYVRPLLGRPSHGHTPLCFSYTFTSMKAELKEQWDQRICMCGCCSSGRPT